jgi:hypothetical protein
LLCRSFSVSSSPICQSFRLVAKPFEFYLGSHWSCLLALVYSLLFAVLSSKFWVYFKVLNPLWVDTCSRWKTWI